MEKNSELCYYERNDNGFTLNMKDQNLIESYLLRLERALIPLSSSERAKIVLENHTHISEALNKYPDKTTQELLEDLGSPEKVANHYLMDKGLKTYKPKKNSFLKFFLYSSGTFLLLFVGIITFVVWKFTPIYKYDEENKRVIILGGLVDLNQKSGEYKILNEYKFVENQFTNSFEGSIEVRREEYDEIVVNFQSGMMTFENSQDTKLAWNCKLENPPTDDFMSFGTDMIEMDFVRTGGSSCTIEVPIDMKLTAFGENAQVILNEPEYDSYVEIDNGQIVIGPNPEIDYKYDLSVKNGAKDIFESSLNEKAYEIKGVLENGSISKKTTP